MNKVLLGVVVGAVLGVFDGLTALLHGPEFREQIVSIVLGSTVKGVVAGVAAGLFARWCRSLVGGIAFGLAVGALLAWPVAMGVSEEYQRNLYFAVMIPGAIAGGIVGFATQHYGRAPAKTPS
ncbi:MAG: hypothetical protein IT457_16180 [Planctomycetes bacterium]|nr:hypothetical protein [Planctomycetota bacterium]